jgi:hypothetical protein
LYISLSSSGSGSRISTMVLVLPHLCITSPVPQCTTRQRRPLRNQPSDRHRPDSAPLPATVSFSAGSRTRSYFTATRQNPFPWNSGSRFRRGLCLA